MHVHMQEMHAKEDGLQDNTYIQTYSTCIMHVQKNINYAKC